MHDDLVHYESIVARKLFGRRWDEEELFRRPKGNDFKAGIARRLRQETAATYDWIARRLKMGAVRAAPKGLVIYLLSSPFSIPNIEMRLSEFELSEWHNKP